MEAYRQLSGRLHLNVKRVASPPTLSRSRVARLNLLIPRLLIQRMHKLTLYFVVLKISFFFSKRC